MAVLDINLTQMQFFICCVVIMLLCFCGCIFVFSRFLLKIISHANAQSEKDEKNKQISLTKEHKQKKNGSKEVHQKRVFLLILAVFCAFGVMDQFADSIPTIFNTSSNLGVSVSIFFLFIVGVGLFFVILYIPYKILKIIIANAEIEGVNDTRENKKD